MGYYLVMVLGNSKAKLALALTSLADNTNNVKYLKEEIALMTGLTRETISRMLSELNQLGIIQTKNRYVKLIKLNELKKLINSHKNSVN